MLALAPEPERDVARDVARIAQAAEREALYQCQMAIRNTAKFGDAETPPPRPNLLGDNSFLYFWPEGSFYFRNGFNAKVPQSASCRGYTRPFGITQLIVGDQIIIDTQSGT